MPLLETETAHEVPRIRRPSVVFGYVRAVVCYLIIGVVLLELGSRVLLSVYRHFHTATVEDFTPDSPAYSRFDWAPQCITEQEFVRLNASTMS